MKDSEKECSGCPHKKYIDSVFAKGYYCMMNGRKIIDGEPETRCPNKGYGNRRNRDRKK